MIHPKMSMDIFGVLLVFYGMVIFVQDVRLFQLLVKVCAVLLIGWQVYALLLPFIFGSLAVTVRKRTLLPRLFCSVNRICFAASRYVLLGGVSLLLGVVILTLNFSNEYFAMNGEKRLTELPSFRSMQYRTGMNEEFNASHQRELAWENFLKEEFRRLGQISLPYVVLGAVGMLNDDEIPQ